MTDFERFQATRQFGSLDALRALAILAVIWQHCPGLPEGTIPLVDPGASGVALFFVLSGFLITTLLLREEAHNGTISLRNFYIRRSLRIFPLYYAVLGLYAALIFFSERSASGGLNAAGRLFFHNLPYYATYTSNWFVDLIVNDDGQRRVIFVFAWSLATEEQFYIVWPSLFRFLKRPVAVTILVVIAATSLGLRLGLHPIEEPATVADRALRIAKSPSIEICCGVLIAIAMNSRSRFQALWAVLGRPWSAPVAAALALTVMVTPIPADHYWYVHVWYAAQALAFSALIAACVIREDHGLVRPLRLRFLSRIGVVSYGMYLLHSLAVHGVKAVLARAGVDVPFLAFGLAVVGTYGVAEVSYRVFESRFLRLKDRFSASRPGTAVVGRHPDVVPTSAPAEVR